MSRTRLLVVLAHPDDETFICGGALANLVRAGGEVHLVCATRGEHGRRLGKPPYATRESLPQVRTRELEAACQALGIAGLQFLGLRDKCLEFEDPEDLAARVAAHVRRLEPQGLLTFHEARGGHTDHCAIGRAATLAWEHAGDPGWHPEQLVGGTHAHQPPRLYHLASGEVAEHPEHHGATPAQITRVPVGTAAAAKLRAFRAHRTQTQLDDWVWGDEAAAVARLAQGVEVFVQLGQPFAPGEQGLLGLTLPDSRRDE